MLSKKIVVNCDHGLHARVAMQVSRKSSGLDSQVTICKGCEKADGCSVLQLLLLGAEKGTELELIVNGGDEEKNLADLSDLFAEGSGI